MARAYSLDLRERVVAAAASGFHRALQREGIESYVVDAASIATSRRRRRAKTDRIDGEALVRALLAYKRGEPRVCAMVRAPTPEDEDSRRVCRERKTLTVERIQHIRSLANEIDLDPPDVPEAELPARPTDGPGMVLSSAWNWVEATQRLKARKAYDNDDSETEPAP